MIRLILSYSKMQNAKEETIMRAINAIENGTYTYRQAHETFDVPISTLHRRLKTGNQKKLPTVLTADEEKQFVSWVTEMAHRGFPISKEQLKDSVQTYLNFIDRQTCFTYNRPGRDWFDRFIKRHPIIVQRTAESVTRSQAEVTEQSIRNWFTEVKLSSPA